MADGDSDALAGAADVMDHLASGANRDEPPADARSNNSSVTPLHITNREIKQSALTRCEWVWSNAPTRLAPQPGPASLLSGRTPPFTGHRVVV
jgi:hypothetical protein